MKKLFRTQRIEAWFLLIILALIWGSSYILIKKGLESFSPDLVGTLRITFAFLFMLPFSLKHIRSIPQGKWKIVFFTGMIGNLIPAILFALAETNLESSLAGILNSLTPLFTLIVAVYVFGFKINISQILGLVLGFIGAIGLSFINAKGQIGSMNVYVWYVVLATVCYAISLNFIKAYLSDVPSIVITSLALMTTGPLSIFYVFSTDFLQIVRTSPKSYESLIYIALLGISGTAIALILYTRLIKMTSPIFSSSVTYLIPIGAIIWGIIDGESLHFLHFVVMTIILSGVFVVNKSEKFRKESQHDVVNLNSDS